MATKTELKEWDVREYEEVVEENGSKEEVYIYIVLISLGG